MINYNHEDENQQLTNNRNNNPTGSEKIKSNFDGEQFLIIYLDLEQPGIFFCPKCENNQNSVMEHTFGSWTIGLALCLCFSTIICGFIPLVCHKCQDKTFFCQKCQTYAGRKQFKPCCK